MSARPAPRLRGEGGFTLPELLVTITLTSIILAALTASLVLALRTTGSASDRLTEANGSQQVAAYFVADVQSANELGTEVITGCADAPGDVIRINGGLASSEFSAIYRVAGDTIERVLCTGGGPPTTKSLASDVVSAFAWSSSPRHAAMTVVFESGQSATFSATTRSGVVTLPPPPAGNQPPTPMFVVDCTLLACDVDGSGSFDSDGTITAYSWAWGDSSPPGSGATASHVYGVAGIYDITLTVLDDDGEQATTTHAVTVPPNQIPTAGLHIECDNLDCTFDGSSSTDSDGTIVTYSWNFGDSSPAGSGVTTLHSYAAGGTYNVALTVTDDDGDGAVATDSVTAVPNVSPTAAFTFGCTGTACTFDADGSADTDGSIAQYAWDFGDGTTATSVTELASHTYATSGTRTVTLMVTDDDDATASTSHIVTVNAPPVAAFTVTCNNSSRRCDVNGSGSTDDGFVATYAWSWGDGATTGPSSSSTANHTYGASGSFTITLTVADAQGLTDSTTRTVTINQPPTASFTINCNPSRVCTFDASGSTDVDGSVVAYEWDWSDLSSNSIGVVVSRSFSNSNQRSVTLTVTDDDGATGQVSRTYRPRRGPTASFAVSCFGHTCTVDGDTSDPGDGDIVEWHWEWGDDTTTTDDDPDAAHTYPDSSPRVITLTVTNAYGYVGSTTRSVSIRYPDLREVSHRSTWFFGYTRYATLEWTGISGDDVTIYRCSGTATDCSQNAVNNVDNDGGPREISWQTSSSTITYRACQEWSTTLQCTDDVVVNF